jgi:DNA modification methylase
MQILLEHDRCIVAHASWQELLPALGHKSVDHVITDPPYTDHVHGNIRSCNTTGAVKVKSWGVGFDSLQDYDLVPAMLSVAKRWVLCFCALEQFGEYQNAAGGQRSTKNKSGRYVRSGIWRKKQAAPQLSGDRPANSCEGFATMSEDERLLSICDEDERLLSICDEAGGIAILGSHEKRLSWNGRGTHAYWCVEEGRERNGEKEHPAQKPEALMKLLIEKFTDLNDWVLDPFCGRGSTGLAALSLGRKIILCDQDERWAQRSAELCQGRLDRLKEEDSLAL